MLSCIMGISSKTPTLNCCVWKEPAACLLVGQVSGHKLSQTIINNTLQKGSLVVPQRHKNASVKGDLESEGWSAPLLSFVWKAQKGCPLCTYLIGLSMAGWEFSAARHCLACIEMRRGAGDCPKGKLFIIPQTPLTNLCIRTAPLPFSSASLAPNLTVAFL